MTALAMSSSLATHTQASDQVEQTTQAGPPFRREWYAEKTTAAEEAVKAAEQAFGPNAPQVADRLIELASWNRACFNDDAAEIQFRRALAIREQAFGKENLQVADVLFELANLYEIHDRYAEIEPLYERALAIEEQNVGPDSPWLCGMLEELIHVYCVQGKLAKAGSAFDREVAIAERSPSPAFQVQTDPDALLETATQLPHGAFDNGGCQAEIRYKHVLATWERTLGKDHPKVATVLERYAGFLRDVGRKEEAEMLEARAKNIRIKSR
ncbi:MAG: tetratricopeptide repeat protein [Candidatus Omnitrophica bacterium]|nr:tetratricopeptide repeat protein [Candidatus Omnitrophota bacterium]